MADERVIRIRLDGSAAREGAQVVNVSLANVGSTAQKVSKEFDGVAAAVQKDFNTMKSAINAWSSQIDQGGIKAQRSAVLVTQGFEQMREAIDAVRKAGHPVPPEWEAELKSLNEQIEANVSRLARLKNTQQDVNDAMRAAQAQTDLQRGSINDLGDIMERTNPKWAKLLGGASAVAGAFYAGYEAGTKLLEVLNYLTDGKFGQKIQGFFDTVLAGLPQWAQELAGIKGAWGDANEDMQRFYNLANILRKNGLDPANKSLDEMQRLVEGLGKKSFVSSEQMDKMTKAAEAQRKKMRDLAADAAAIWLKPLETRGDKQAAIDSAAFYSQASDGVKKLIDQLKLEERVKRDMAKIDAENDAAFLAHSDAVDKALKKWREDWDQYVRDPGVRAWQATKDAALDAITTILTGGRVNFKDLFKSILEMWVRTLLEMVQRWYAAQAAMKAANLANTDGSKPFSMSSLASAFGMGGGSSGFSWSALGTYAGYAAAIAIWVKVLTGLYKGWTDKGLQNGEASIGGGTSGKNRDLIAQAQGLIDQLVGQVKDLAKSWDLGLKEMTSGSVTIGINKSGKSKSYYVKSALDNVGAAFKTYEEALDYAQVQALKFATFSDKTSRLVASVIRNTRAKTTADLGEDINVARTIDSFGPAATNEIKSFTAELDNLRTRIRELVPASQELTDALANINTEEVRRWQNLRDQITGRQRTAEEELADRRAQAEQFNAERSLRLADLEMTRLEIQARIANYQAHQEFTKGMLGSAGTVAKGVIYMASVTGAADAYLDGLFGQLKAIEDLIAAITNIAPIDPGEIRVPRTGGGGTNNRQQVRDFIRGKELDQLGPAQRALAELNKEYDDAAKLAKGHADELKRINELRKEETKLLRDQVRDSTRRQRADFLGVGGDYGAQIRNIKTNAENLQKALQDAFKAGAIGAKEFNNSMADVQRRAQELQAQVLQGGANEILLQLYDYLGMDSEAAKLRHEIAVAELLLKQQELQTALAIANLSETQRRNIESTLEAIGVLIPKVINDPLFGVGGGGGGSAYSSTLSDGADAASDLWDEFRKGKDAIRDFRNALKLDENLSPLTPEQRLSEAQAQFQALAQQALTGDVTAIQGIPEAARAFLEIARSFFASSDGYQQIFNYVDSILQQILAVQVPHLASGGMVSSPTLALVGEAGPEVVVPIGVSSSWHAAQMAGVSASQQTATEVRMMRRDLRQQSLRKPIERKRVRGGR